LHPDDGTVPLALRETVAYNHVIHDHVFIVTTLSQNVPHVVEDERCSFEKLPSPLGTITWVKIRFGFQDEQDVPTALGVAQRQGLAIEPDQAFYFLSRITVHRGKVPGLASWRKRLFVGLAHNAANPSQYFSLPESRTVVMGAQVVL
ncbi:MAG: KUP/HAK/KT family potassium transporter, partial [Actinomycetes bacterium]